MLSAQNMFEMYVTWISVGVFCWFQHKLEVSQKGSEWPERPMKFDTDLFQKVFFETFEILLVYVFCWNQQKSLKNLVKATIIPIKFVLFGYYFTRKGCSRLKAVSIHIWWRLQTTFAYKCYMKVLTSSVADCEEAGTLI